MNRYKKRMDEIGATMRGSYLGYPPISLSESELQLFEDEIGAPLPDDYREFLKDYGFYECSLFYEFSRDSGYDLVAGIGSFGGIYPKGYTAMPYNDTVDLRSLREGFLHSIPPEFICIAHNDSNGYLCLAVKGDERGSVYYLDRVEDWDAVDGVSWFKLADSFGRVLSLFNTE